MTKQTIDYLKTCGVLYKLRKHESGYREPLGISPVVCCGLLVISVKSVVKLRGQNFGDCLTEESATPTTGPEMLFSPVPGSQNGADAIIVSRPAVMPCWYPVVVQ